MTSLATRLRRVATAMPVSVRFVWIAGFLGLALPGESRGEFVITGGRASFVDDDLLSLAPLSRGVASAMQPEEPRPAPVNETPAPHPDPLIELWGLPVSSGGTGNGSGPNVNISGGSSGTLPPTVCSVAASDASGRLVRGKILRPLDPPPLEMLDPPKLRG